MAVSFWNYVYYAITIMSLDAGHISLGDTFLHYTGVN